MIPGLDPNDELITAIQNLRFDPNARLSLCMAPLATLVWKDEQPPNKYEYFLRCREAWDFMWMIFGIRNNYWKTGELPEKHLDLWIAAQSLCPDWPLFKRLELDEEGYKSLRAAEMEQDEIFDYLANVSSDFNKGEDEFGRSHYKATFDRNRMRAHRRRLAIKAWYNRMRHLLLRRD